LWTVQHRPHNSTLGCHPHCQTLVIISWWKISISLHSQAAVRSSINGKLISSMKCLVGWRSRKRWNDENPLLEFLKSQFTIVEWKFSLNFLFRLSTKALNPPRVYIAFTSSSTGGILWKERCILPTFSVIKQKQEENTAFILKHVPRSLLQFPNSFSHEFLSLRIIALLKPSSVQWIFNLQILYVVPFSLLIAFDFQNSKILHEKQ